MPQSTIPAIVAARRQAGDGAAKWTNPLATLPADIDDILRCAAGESSALAVAAAAGSARPAIVESACRWFVRHVLFRPGASYYWNLGVERDASLDTIRAHYRQLISVFHPDRLEQSDERVWYEDFAKRVNESYNTLKHAETRARYDRAQHATFGGEGSSMHAAQPAAERGAAQRARTGAAATRARWRAAPTRGAWADWIDNRSPATLKLLSVGAVLLVAVTAVAVVRMQHGVHSEIALPADPQVVLGAGERQLPLADLVAPAVPQTTISEALTKRDALPASARAAEGSSTRTVVPGSTRDTSDRSVGPVASPFLAAERRESAPAPIRVADNALVDLPVAIAIPVGRVADGSTPIALAPVVPATPVVSAIPLPAEPRAPLTNAAIDGVIGRFAAAYESGDMNALVALLEPGATQSDAMAFALANFNRLFRESVSRHVEMRELTRASEPDHALVRLQTRASVVGRDNQRRIGVGQLTLVLERSGDLALIRELTYSEQVPG